MVQLSARNGDMTVDAGPVLLFGAVGLVGCCSPVHTGFAGPLGLCRPGCVVHGVASGSIIRYVLSVATTSSGMQLFITGS